jgi:hypothetical protein
MLSTTAVITRDGLSCSIQRGTTAEPDRFWTRRDCLGDFACQTAPADPVAGIAGAARPAILA